MRLAAALLLLSGCTFARVRYADAAAREAKLLVCEAEANELACREYFSANRADGVQVVPLNSQPRVDM